MIDLKSVIDFISIKYCKKVSSIVRQEYNDKNWLVIFEGETEFEFIKLSDEEVNRVNMFYEMYRRMYVNSVDKE